MTEIKWIKLSVNMFNDEKIKLIRTMPEGDKIIVIWVQLLCLAGKTNDNGSIYMGQHIYYTDEMLATLCDQPLNIMRIAIKTLEQFEMIEKTDSGILEIVNWEKHQNIEGMEKIREQNRLRKQRQRNKQLSYQGKQLSHVTSRDSHATDKEEDKEEDKEKNKEKSCNSSKLKYDDTSIYLILSYELYELILSNNSGAKEPNFQKWADDFRKMIEIDKRDEQHLREVMQWSQRDSFWKGNILSANKFRQKFDQLAVQSGKAKPYKKPTNQLDWE